MNISIIYEDDDILVVDKPAGMTVNRAETTRNEETVQDWMERKLQFTNYELRIAAEAERKANEENNWDPKIDFYKRGGVVHRLDKETSGVMILAKNPDAFADLQRQFKERVVKKTYLALAHGKVVPYKGEINVPVGRLPWNRMRFGVVPGGRESVTFYTVLNYYYSGKDTFSYLELSPKSGRTHQIRVHLQYLGYPIFADFLYAGRKTAKKDRKLLSRVFLHAARILFTHPKTGKDLVIESALPEELSKLMVQLKKVEDLNIRDE